MSKSGKSRKTGTTQATPEWNDSVAVDELMSQLVHPLKPVVGAIRRTILSAGAAITEGVKWNSPSFYRNRWFATVNVHREDSVVVVFHVGAKVKDNSSAGLSIKDDTGLLEWVAKERAVARFCNLEDFETRKAAFKAIVGQWASQMPQP